MSVAPDGQPNRVPMRDKVLAAAVIALMSIWLFQTATQGMEVHNE